VTPPHLPGGEPESAAKTRTALSWIFAFVALTVRGRQDGADGRVRRDLPARLRQLGVRARLHFPGLAAGVREINPVTVTAGAARSFAFYGTPATLGAAAAWIGGLLAVFIPLSVWRYRPLSVWRDRRIS
jgi:oleandomycin transport system permease protein